VFLPGLLFEAAFHLEFSQFWRNRTAILSLAIPGVAAATALTALILTPVADAIYFVQNFTWRHALVFGALISATDPIAVVAVLRNIGAPKRLAVLLEGESLFNDGTAIVFFTLSLSLAAGAPIAAGRLGFDFLTIVGFGALIGTAVGLGVSQVIKQVDDPMIEITLTSIAAYGSFVTAEHFQCSGVIATVAAGMFCGNYAVRTGMSASTRVAVETFWQYLAFALNSMVFLLIGFEVQIASLFASWRAIIVAYIIVTVGRGIIIFVVSSLLSRTRERIPRSWSMMLTWGGLRGGLPMVLVLSLPRDFSHRDLLVTMTFGVVLLSLLLQGMTISPLLRWLGIVKGREERQEYEFARGKLQAANAALAELDNMPPGFFADKQTQSALRTEYESIREKQIQRIKDLQLDPQQLHAEKLQWGHRHLLLKEKNYAINAFHQGVLSQDVYEKLLADIDARLLQIESGDYAEPEKTKRP
jgi:CPA1 family monovalent cation:H+ antiporter